MTGIAPRLRWVAVLDLILTAQFILPPVVAGLIGVLLRIEADVMGSERTLAMPDPAWMIFTSIMGILGVTWAAARLVVEDDRLCLIDAVARLCVAALIGYAMMVLSLPLVFGAFIVTEVIGTLATALAWSGRRGVEE
jgi:hypothetical protein